MYQANNYTSTPKLHDNKVQNELNVTVCKYQYHRSLREKTLNHYCKFFTLLVRSSDPENI